MTEDHYIARWLKLWSARQGLKVGPGDDCAVLHALGPGQDLVWKTDAMVRGVHFRPEDSGALVGRKALARVLSDFAAMGARPLSCLVTLGIPSDLPPRFLDDCYRGMAKLAKPLSLSLAGGETTRCRDFWISVNGLGSIPAEKAVTRSGAKAGDLLFVTGRLGGSFPRRHLRFVPRLPEGQWLREKAWASSMMDLSDGLGKDLPRLARTSGVSYRIHSRTIPRTAGRTPGQAVNDGEDYELLFTVPPAKAAGLLKTWPFRTKLTCIGLMASASLPDFNDGLDFQGYDHFQQTKVKTGKRR